MSIKIKMLNRISRLSMQSLFTISDYLLYPLLHRFYRRDLVRKNLQLAFPEMSPEERTEIERKFYHWLCDLFVETIKVHNINKDDITKYFVWKNADLVEAKNKEAGKGFACCYLSHYCNWELAVGLPFYLARLGMCQIYHPLKDQEMDEWMKRNRSQFGAKNIPMKYTVRRLIDLDREAKNRSLSLPNGNLIEGWMLGCIADQLPKKSNIHLRIPFLNQDTAVFTGSEKLARKFNMTVWYVRIIMPSRGHYEAVFEPIDATKEQLENDEFYYTRQYFARLEQQIRERPELWLWTHNRWKR